jgi:hypothetical protein
MYTDIVEGPELQQGHEELMKQPPMQVARNYLFEHKIAMPIWVQRFAVPYTFGYLMIVTTKLFEETDILIRFAKVFDQTYTRFLDLQKAEAQAREAQIEAGLERVRSRAMAMQTSEELNELIGTVFTELTKLDLVLTRCVILIYEGAEKGVRWWMANSEAPSTPMNFFVKYADMPFFNEYLKGWHERALRWQYVLEGENKIKTDEFLFHETELSSLPDFVIAGMRAPGRVYLNASFNNFGNLTLASLEPLSNEHFDILLRFAKVFDLTYTRFNDLKQAEAQAREAQIQLALERVRARTMAMQRSEELSEVATLLFQQVKTLGVPQWTCGFCIWDIGDTECRWYSGSPDGEILAPARFPLTEHPVFRTMDESRKRGDELFIFEKEGELQADHYRYLMTLPGVRERLQDMLDSGLSIPPFQIDHYANFAYGNLIFITYEHFPEMHDVFKRFAKVFDQTYTRFLDLQNAEAQARESQIQLALERARAQSMMMQHSSELDDTLRVFHEQVLQLGIPSAFSFLWLPDEEKDRHIFWAAWAENNLTVFKSKAINYPLDRNEPATAQCLVDWKSSQPVVSYHVPPGEVENYFAAWQELVGGVHELTPEYFSDGLHYVEAFLKYGCFGVMVKNELREDEKKILARFAIEFERTYTRFLDLQKAEAQAREAKIEAALERIRSRSLAMHQSNEIGSVVAILFEKLKELGLIFDGGAGIHFFTEGSKDAVICVISPELSAPIFNDLPYDEEAFVNNPIILDVWQAKETGEHIINKTYSFEQKNRYFKDYLFKYNDDLNKLPQSLRNFILNAASYTATFISEKNSLLGASSWTEQMFSEADVDVLKRVARVFEQAYIRFLDLQKAEAQARQAEIELALERVRAKVMAMTTSRDLNNTSLVFGEQLRNLGIDWQFSYFWLVDEAKDENTFWITWPDYRTSFTAYTMAEAEDYFNECLVAWRGGIKIHDNYVSLPDVQPWLDTYQRITDEAGGVAIQVMKAQNFPQGIFYYDAMMKYGSFGVLYNRPSYR